MFRIAYAWLLAVPTVLLPLPPAIAAETYPQKPIRLLIPFPPGGGTDIEQVPYKGGGPATVGLISGETQVLITSIMGAMPHMRSGRMRGLAVTTRQRSPVLPDLPTIDEAGVPGYDKAGWFGLFAPAAVPSPMIDHVYQAMAKVLKDPATVKRLATDGATAVGNPPAEFDAFVRTEIAEWGKLIREMKL